MGAVEPVAEVGGGLVGCLTIERHHGCRHPGNPDNVGAPAFFGDPCHFDDEGSAGNGSFKTVPHDVYECEKLKRGAPVILRTARRKTSETKYEGGMRLPFRGDSRRIQQKKNFVVA